MADAENSTNNDQSTHQIALLDHDIQQQALARSDPSRPVNNHFHISLNFSSPNELFDNAGSILGLLSGHSTASPRPSTSLSGNSTASPRPSTSQSGNNGNSQAGISGGPVRSSDSTTDDDSDDSNSHAEDDIVSDFSSSDEDPEPRRKKSRHSSNKQRRSAARTPANGLCKCGKRVPDALLSCLHTFCVKCVKKAHEKNKLCPDRGCRKTFRSWKMLPKPRRSG